MTTGIYHNPPDLSLYIAEILKTWGLPYFRLISPADITNCDPDQLPVLVCPADCDYSAIAGPIFDYIERGGQVICIQPATPLATMAGLVCEGHKETPLRLRVSARPAAGLAGELLPVVGQANVYRAEEKAEVIVWLTFPGRYHDESPGITETRVGRGRIVVFAFDLPLSVLLMRQGDPALAEQIPEGDGCARPSHMAADIGPNDAAWMPYADLLSRLLVDQIRHLTPGPMPMISHLPGAAPGILLYSGDEDGAAISANEEEFDAVHAADGRMSLYIIPTGTLSTAEDVQRYSARHDIGPHPNLRPLDGRPVAERIQEFERQILMFQEMFGVTAYTLRNHCTAWAGYLEPVAIMEKLGVRMDGNYFSGTYMRDRESAPYAGFGAAMPMRFCTPEGRMYDVYQQHTHLSDDVLFGDADYSFRYSPEQFEVIAQRIFTDIVHRFHTPYAVCIHPGNWVKFSRQQGLTLLEKARAFDLPIWSFDQWAAFCEARDSWRLVSMAWSHDTLHGRLEGETTHEGLRLILPVEYRNLTLKDVEFDGKSAVGETVTRYGQAVRLLPWPVDTKVLDITARYDVK